VQEALDAAAVPELKGSTAELDANELDANASRPLSLIRTCATSIAGLPSRSTRTSASPALTSPTRAVHIRAAQAKSHLAQQDVLALC
jgi:hypothetical protein